MNNNLSALAKLIRYYILTSTTAAGSGHPTSSLSAADVMASLMFGGYFKYDLDNPANPNNDRLIFSKGHASPLFYSLYAAAGKVSEQEMLTLRKMGSRLEGHPTMQFPYTEVPTGSLGQGLGVGVGMAINAKYLDKLGYRTFVLLGDGEMAEGSVWEAMQIAAYYKLNNLVAILDCNRLGQSRETMVGHHAEIFEQRAKAFGWNAVVIDGHDLEQIQSAYAKALAGDNGAPTMIIARTLKGKGVSFLEDKENWHGKALSQEDLKKALEELGEVDKKVVGKILTPTPPSRHPTGHLPLTGEELRFSPPAEGPTKLYAKLDKGESPAQQGEEVGVGVKFSDYDPAKPVATRKAYGKALVNIHDAFPQMVVLDGETSNSTFAETFKKAYPDKYFEMFIAEQGMVSAALGLSCRGKIPFISTFAAFFTRAFDQIRMSQYARSNIKFCGSHAGVSIGEDGSSQMALEDLAMFRTLAGSVVLYPSDAVSAEKLVSIAAAHQGNVYIRTTRKDTAILYGQNEEFKIGGSKTLKSSDSDQVTVIGAGVTLHEALAAWEELKKEGINIRVIDLYSIKPIDGEALKKAAQETKAIITVEDHHAEGGIGEAVISALFSLHGDHGGAVSICQLAVRKEPHSAKPDELLAYEEINKDAIVKKIKEIVL